jgi:hypothetical protein
VVEDNGHHATVTIFVNGASTGHITLRSDEVQPFINIVQTPSQSFDFEDELAGDMGYQQERHHG